MRWENFLQTVKRKDDTTILYIILEYDRSNLNHAKYLGLSDKKQFIEIYRNRKMI